jgi:excisionase family DNA binding protein
VQLLTYPQAAELLNLKLGTLYSLVSANRVPHIRISKRFVRFDRLELQQWIDARRVSPETRAGCTLDEQRTARRERNRAYTEERDNANTLNK